MGLESPDEPSLPLGFSDGLSPTAQRLKHMSEAAYSEYEIQNGHHPYLLGHHHMMMPKPHPHSVMAGGATTTTTTGMSSSTTTAATSPLGNNLLAYSGLEYDPSSQQMTRLSPRAIDNQVRV